jgi:hypothetical protein
MTVKPTSLLDEMLAAWTFTREGVVDEVKNLPESALAFRPNDASRTAREIVRPADVGRAVEA